MTSLKRLFSAAPEGTAALFFIQIFATLGFAVLYSTLVLYATKHLHFSRERGHDVHGRVWRVQLRPAPLRRLPRRAVPVQPESVRRRHGAAGHRLRVHRGRHGRAVLRRPRLLPYRQRPERHLYQHDAHAALHPGRPAPRRSVPLELRRHERRLLRRLRGRRLLPGDRELLRASSSSRRSATSSRSSSPCFNWKTLADRNTRCSMRRRSSSGCACSPASAILLGLVPVVWFMLQQPG